MSWHLDKHGCQPFPRRLRKEISLKVIRYDIRFYLKHILGRYIKPEVTVSLCMNSMHSLKKEMIVLSAVFSLAVFKLEHHGQSLVGPLALYKVD